MNYAKYIGLSFAPQAKVMNKKLEHELNNLNLKYFNYVGYFLRIDILLLYIFEKSSKAEE